MKDKFAYFYVSRKISLYSELSEKFSHCHFDIRFHCLANHPKLKEYLQFVPQNIDKNDNSGWFASYLLAFDKFDKYHDKEDLRKRLLNNELLTIYVSDDYEHKEKWLEIYNNIKPEFKQ